MKRQQEIVKLFYCQGDRVRWVQPTFSQHAEPMVNTRLAHGIVHTECTDRPGFYYVRDELDKRLHLVGWFDLEIDPAPAESSCPLHPNAAGKVDGCIGCK